MGDGDVFGGAGRLVDRSIPKSNGGPEGRTGVSSLGSVIGVRKPSGEGEARTWETWDYNVTRPLFTFLVRGGAQLRDIARGLNQDAD